MIFGAPSAPVLSSLKVPDQIAEMVLGHGRGDVLERTYDLHRYEGELREALELWAGRVRDIVTPSDPREGGEAQGESATVGSMKMKTRPRVHLHGVAAESVRGSSFAEGKRRQG